MSFFQGKVASKLNIFRLLDPRQKEKEKKKEKKKEIEIDEK